jgi:hypothetical protein
MTSHPVIKKGRGDLVWACTRSTRFSRLAVSAQHLSAQGAESLECLVIKLQRQAQPSLDMAGRGAGLGP